MFRPKTPQMLLIALVATAAFGASTADAGFVTTDTAVSTAGEVTSDTLIGVATETRDPFAPADEFQPTSEDMSGDTQTSSAGGTPPAMIADAGLSFSNLRQRLVLGPCPDPLTPDLGGLSPPPRS